MNRIFVEQTEYLDVIPVCVDMVSTASVYSGTSYIHQPRRPNGISSSYPPVMTDRTAALGLRWCGLLRWDIADVGPMVEVGPSQERERHVRQKNRTLLLATQAAGFRGEAARRRWTGTGSAASITSITINPCQITPNICIKPLI
ncbi:hypothetical protein J6590_039649 [Homalodisca vitripennis]|nr:hypothetical protein J6590_039649 [Homalodisca vitripennis]